MKPRKKTQKSHHQGAACGSGGSSRLAGNLKVAGFDPLAECRGVPEQDASNHDCSRRAWRSPLAWSTPSSVCECVHELVNVRQYCTGLRVATGENSAV